MKQLRARQEWQFFGVLPQADRALAIAWWVVLGLRGVLPALFAIAVGVLVGAVQRGDALAGPLALAGGALYRSDGMAPWRPIGLPESAAGALATLMGQAPVWLVAQAAGGIARSDDGGASWATIAPEGGWAGDVSALAAVSYHIDMALAGSASGQLAQSADRGRTWQVLKQGLGPIRSIAAARLA